MQGQLKKCMGGFSQHFSFKKKKTKTKQKYQKQNLEIDWASN